MIVTLILGLLCMLLNYLAYLNNSDWGLKASFILIFLFLGFRYDYGNDYETYIELFNRVEDTPDIAFDPSMYIFYEPGWMLLNWLCRPIGFFGMTILLGGFYSIIVYKFIRRYVSYEYYWIAVFFVIFNSGFLLVHSTAMRQTVAILIFIISTKYLINKKIIPFIICLILASTFHYTALIVLFISPFLFYNRKMNLVYGSILFSIYLTFFLFSNVLAPYVGQLVSVFSERYEAYSEKGTANSGLGFVFYSTIFLLTLCLDRFQERKVASYFKIAIVYFMLMPFTLIIEMTARIGMYFSPSIIIVYPFIYKTLKSKIYQTTFVTILILFTVYQFFQFFYSDTYKNYFMEYRTVFSAPQWN